MTTPAEPEHVPPTIVRAALLGLCPRCGQPTLFAGVAKFADRCRACALDFTAFDVGDGPAAFLTLIVGTVVMGLAIFVQLRFDPPLWVQMLLWIPVTGLLVLGSLRIAKAALMAAEYRNKPPAERPS